MISHALQVTCYLKNKNTVNFKSNSMRGGLKLFKFKIKVLNFFKFKIEGLILWTR